MQSTLVSTGSGALQTDFTKEYQEGMETLEYSPDIEFQHKLSEPFQDPQSFKESKKKTQVFPAKDDHTISIHIVNTISMYHDLHHMEKWVDESLTKLEHALKHETINFANSEILNQQQIGSLKQLLGRTHITFGDYKDAVHHKNNMLRTYIIKIWNNHHFKPQGRPDAIMYSDVVRMKKMFPNLHGMSNSTIIGTTALLGGNPKHPPKQQLHALSKHLDNQAYKKDPKCFSMLVSLQDTVSAIAHHMHDVATAQHSIVPTHYDMDNSSGRVIDVITSGVIKGRLSPQGTLIAPPANKAKRTYTGPGVSFNNMGVGPNQTATIGGAGGGVGGGVNIGINFDTSAAQALIQEIVAVLQGIEVVVLILSSNGFTLIQALEEMLDSLIDQLAEQLMMESMSVLSMIQGAVLAPLGNLMFQLDLDIGPFVVNADAWTNAAGLLVSAIESITGRFYGRLLDWYRKALQQLNGSLNKLAPTSTNNQYGHLLTIINEIITWLQQLNFAELNVGGGQTINFIAPTLNLNQQRVGFNEQVQLQVPPDQTPADIQAIKNKVSHKLKERYKHVAKLSAPPKLSMQFPHIQSSVENTITSLPMGQLVHKGTRTSIAADLLKNIDTVNHKNANTHKSPNAAAGDKHTNTAHKKPKK